MPRVAGLILALGAAGLALAAPAVARTIVYGGTADFTVYSSNSNLHPEGTISGSHSYLATFRYDDALAMTTGDFSVDGTGRLTFACPYMIGFCQPLGFNGISIGSSVAFTPEDGMQLYVDSPSGFGGIDLLAPGSHHYALGGGDDSGAFLTVTNFYSPALGFVYSEGHGTVSFIDSVVPEPGSWATMIAGFGLTGAVQRHAAWRRRRATKPV